ncbi:hypothetical protein RI367_004169 [Sorochytrium milnesiophthora]
MSHRPPHINLASPEPSPPQSGGHVLPPSPQTSPSSVVLSATGASSLTFTTATTPTLISQPPAEPHYPSPLSSPSQTAGQCVAGTHLLGLTTPSASSSSQPREPRRETSAQYLQASYSDEDDLSMHDVWSGFGGDPLSTAAPATARTSEHGDNVISSDVSADWLEQCSQLWEPFMSDSELNWPSVTSIATAHSADSDGVDHHGDGDEDDDDNDDEVLPAAEPGQGQPLDVVAVPHDSAAAGHDTEEDGDADAEEYTEETEAESEHDDEEEDDEDYYDGHLGLLRKMPAEVTREDHLRGTDVQGVDWSALPISRDRYRDERIKASKSFRNTLYDLSNLRTLLPVQSRVPFYQFNHSNLAEKCCFNHFQLRNLIWATSHNEVVFAHDHYVRRWNSALRQTTTLIDSFSDHKVAPGGPIKITTMTAGLGIMAVGGMLGQYVIRAMRKSSTPATGLLMRDNLAITNYMEVAETLSGSVTVLASSNDQKVRRLDAATNTIVQSIDLPWPVNCCVQSPDRRLLATVGDCQETLLWDAQRSEVTTVLEGHLDYSFAAAWSPDGMLLATGNQDRTARVYDVRNLSRSLYTLPAKMGAIRSLRFHPHRRGFLAMAEDADFVHVVDTHGLAAAGMSRFRCWQSIDFFGDVAGISFTPDGERLYIGCSDPIYGAVIQYERRQFDPDYIL